MPAMTVLTAPKAVTAPWLELDYLEVSILPDVCFEKEIFF